MSGAPIMKDGVCRSDVFTEWVRSQPCCGPLMADGDALGRVTCGRQPRSEQHHHPGRGERGAVHDLRSMPVCRWCHMRCEGQQVYYSDFDRVLPPIGYEVQSALVALTFERFMHTAPRDQVDQVMRDLWRWRDSRVFEGIPY